MIIYGLKNCDTCRKALKALSNSTLHDVRANPLEISMITTLYGQFGDALVNKKSTTWRGLNDEERAKNPVELLGAQPALMKRPVIEIDGRFFLGWGEETQKALL